MSKIELLHGSDHVIEKPDFHLFAHPSAPFTA